MTSSPPDLDECKRCGEEFDATLLWIVGGVVYRTFDDTDTHPGEPGRGRERIRCPGCRLLFTRSQIEFS